VALVIALAAPATGATERPSAGKTPPILLDDVIAIVNDRAILRSDIYLEARLAAARRLGAAALTGSPDPRDLAETLDRLIDELVVFHEADRLQVFPVTAGEIDAAVRDLRATIGTREYEQFMSSRQIDEASVRDIIERGLRVRRYLEGRFRLASRATPEEVKAWFEAHPDDFAGKTIEEVRSTIEDQISRTRFDEKTAAFTADVRRRAQVRILNDPASPSAEVRMSGSANASGPVRTGEAR
jgi:hypothetical protein